MNISVSGILWSLSRKIGDAVESLKAREGLVKMRTLYVKPKLENFEINASGNYGFSSTLEYINKEEWHWVKQYDFLQNVIKQLQEYKEAVKQVSKTYSATDAQSDFWLSRFVQVIANQAINRVEEGFIVDLIGTFIADLENSPTDWSVMAWLTGVWPDKDRYELTNGIVLRQLSRRDFEIERPFDMLAFSHPLDFQRIGNSALEFRYRAKDGREIQVVIQEVLDILRLFRLGSVRNFRSDLVPKSLIRFGGSMTTETSSFEAYRYAFHSGDVDSFNVLHEKVIPIFRKLGENQEIFSSHPLNIGFQRYKDALLHATTIESRITLAITCLESLYLKAKERAELSHRLAQRISALLKTHGFTPFEVYENLNQAYEVRSTYIHGSPLDKETLQAAPKLCDAVMEYARVSLLVFFQLYNKIEKDKLINKLDNSLLDESAQSKTRELLTKDILITK